MTAISQRRKLRHRQVGIRSRPQGGYVHWPFWVPYLSRQAVAPMCSAMLWGGVAGPGGCGQAGRGCQHLVPTPACVSDRSADKHGALAQNWVRELPEGHGPYLWMGRGPPSRCSLCLASFLCPERRAPQYDLDCDMRNLEWISAAQMGETRDPVWWGVLPPALPCFPLPGMF